MVSDSRASNLHRLEKLKREMSKLLQEARAKHHPGGSNSTHEPNRTHESLQQDSTSAFIADAQRQIAESKAKTDAESSDALAALEAVKLEEGLRLGCEKPKEC